MKLKSLIILFLSITIFTSCSKPDTSAEFIAQELQEFIEDNSIDRVVRMKLDQSWGDTFIVGDYGLDYEFDGQFIRIWNTYFNLDTLVRYEKKERDDTKYLLLYFP